MKRSAALAPLSRDHQHALDAALRLRRAEPDTVAAAVAHFLAFFEREGQAHFAIEEALVLPALPATDAEWSEAVARVEDDHAAIRAAAEGLEEAGADGPRPSIDPLPVARATGERLDAHVRFEERTLFPLLEARLTPEELERLGSRVADAEATTHGERPQR